MLIVEFESEEFTGSESSGFVEVLVVLNGTSTASISIQVTTTELTAGINNYTQFINYGLMY